MPSVDKVESATEPEAQQKLHGNSTRHNSASVRPVYAIYKTNYRLFKAMSFIGCTSNSLGF